MFPVGHILIFVAVSLIVVISPTEVVPQEIELENYAKQCRAAYDCWRTEPIGPDALPLTLSGKCRCRAGYCQYYLGSTETFFPCDEL